jgi:hypothetical protein
MHANVPQRAEAALTYTHTQILHGNWAGESVRTGLRNVDVQPGRHRLPLAHPLQPLELVQDPIDFTAQDRLTRLSEIIVDAPLNVE